MDVADKDTWANLERAVSKIFSTNKLLDTPTMKLSTIKMKYFLHICKKHGHGTDEYFSMHE